jgi:hypothetical protein
MEIQARPEVKYLSSWADSHKTHAGLTTFCEELPCPISCTPTNRVIADTTSKTDGHGLHILFISQGTPNSANVLVRCLMVKTMYIRLKTVVIKDIMRNKTFYLPHFVLHTTDWNTDRQNILL